MIADFVFDTVRGLAHAIGVAVLTLLGLWWLA